MRALPYLSLLCLACGDTKVSVDVNGDNRPDVRRFFDVMFADADPQDAAPDGPPADAGVDGPLPDLGLDAAMPDAAPDVGPDMAPDQDAPDVQPDMEPDMDHDMDPNCVPRTCETLDEPEVNLLEGLANPLKGFATNYSWAVPTTRFPHSLEYVSLPLRDLMDGPDSFTFEDGLEPWLDAAAARGHHVILRVYLDIPTLPTGVPDYLAEVIAFDAYEEYGGGRSPDYEDERLITALESFIAALGAAYDGDPRLAYLQIGLLGFWGEWHTFPHEDWFPGEATQDRVLVAFDEAFARTNLQVRRPAASSPQLRMGFHDDSFAFSTIGAPAWYFLPSLEAAGAADRWQTVPIGGEIRPQLQGIIFDADYEVGDQQQDYGEAVRATHASYLMNFHAFNGNAGVGYEGAALTAAREGAALLGYALALRSVRLTRSEGCGPADRLFLTIENVGVAPIYAPTAVRVGTGPDARTVAFEAPAPGADPVQVGLDLTGLEYPLVVGLASPVQLPDQRMAWTSRGLNTEGEWIVRGCEIE